MDDVEVPSSESDVLEKSSKRVDLTGKLLANKIDSDVREREHSKQIEEYRENIEKCRWSTNISFKEFREHQKCLQRKVRYFRIITHRKLYGKYLPALGFYFTRNPHLSTSH